jgi:ATP-binding cassette subfamily B protein
MILLLALVPATLRSKLIAVSSSRRRRPQQPAGQATNGVLIRRMLALGWAHRAGCIRVVAQQAILVLLGIGGLGFTGLGIDYIRSRLDPTGPPPHWLLGLAPPADWQPITVVAAIAGAILAVALAQTWLRYRSAVAVAKLTQDIVVQLRSDVYDKLGRLSFRFFDANESGSIINRVTGDVQAVRAFIDNVILQAIVVFISLAVYLAYMLSVHVPLTLACLATTPLLWFYGVRFADRQRPAYQRNRELADKLVLALSENVQGIHVVKGFAREREEIAKFETANARVRSAKQEIFLRLSIFQPLTGMLTQFNLLVLLAYGGYLVIQGRLPLGEGLFVFANLLQQFANQVGQIVNISSTIQSSITGAQRVFEVLDAPVEVDNPRHPVPMIRSRGAIAFENVSFGYRPDHPVLSDVEFNIQPGECVAIVGATGAGKSTLLNLIPRFYDPQAGRILLDGVDIRRFDLSTLRRQIGLVFQENFLFSNTIAANIAFGHPDATRAQIERAARMAAADSFIRQMPGGYDAIVGELGSNLSGGQRQRLAIARALLLEPPVLILDDATTAIDPETEHEILSALETAMRGRTTLVVAHRLSTLRRADRILVVEHGRIVQMGTHTELLACPGHYRESAVLQMCDAEELGRQREVA